MGRCSYKQDAGVDREQGQFGHMCSLTLTGEKLGGCQGLAK